MNVGLPSALAQVDILSPSQRGVRDHFQTGGSVVAVCMVLLIIASLVAAAYAISRIVERPKDAGHAPDAQALFGRLLERLGVTRTRRKLLEQIATEQSLPNPSVILLCPAAFDASVQQWQAGRKSVPHTEIEREIAARVAATRDTLFPSATSIADRPFD